MFCILKTERKISDTQKGKKKTAASGRYSGLTVQPCTVELVPALLQGVLARPAEKAIAYQTVKL